MNGDRPNFAASGFSSLNNSNSFLNGILGLDADAEQGFVPNRTLTVSSAGATIAVSQFPGAFPFAELLGSFDGNGNFNPTTGTISLIPGTNIPVLQIVDLVAGQVRAFNPGIATEAFNAIGGDGIPIGETAPGLTLISENTRLVVASAVDYQIHDNITFFADAKFAYEGYPSLMIFQSLWTIAIGDGGCALINILGSSAIQGACAAFVFADLEDDTTILKHQGLFVVSGDSSNFFELPAGPIGFAGGC